LNSESSYAIMVCIALAQRTMKRSALKVLTIILVCCRDVALGSVDDATLPSAVSLTNAAQVHALPAAEANQHLAVKLEGVITHYNRLGFGFFIQDDTDGCYISLHQQEFIGHVGERVVVEGETTAGDYAPVVELRRLQSLGPGKLPEPEAVTANDLATGMYDSRRVKVRGVVRLAAPLAPASGGLLAMQLWSDGRTLLVSVNTFADASTNLVDAEVVVCGVAAGVFNWQRQLVEPVLMVASDADIKVMRPAPPLDSLQVQTIQSLFRYSPAGFPRHRVRLRGQLLGRQPGRWLVVRDATRGLFVESAGGDNLSPGDELELFGFPEMREQKLWLVNPVVHKLGAGRLAAPSVRTFTSALHHPCELVRMEGTEVGRPSPGEDGWVLNLLQDKKKFEVWLPAAGNSIPDAWRDGARLDVTGIAEPFFSPAIRPTLYPYPSGLRLYARSPPDVLLVRAAPWWTSPRLGKTILFSLLITLILLGWTIFALTFLTRKNAALREARIQLGAARDELAKRYNVRTGEWQEELVARHVAEADFALLTAERTRLARELHDTLEQTLASTALQLDAARGFFRDQPQDSERLLGAATNQLRESQLEVRRSIWNLRSVKLEEITLCEALKQLGSALADLHGPAIDVRCEGEIEHLPPGVASHLFRVAQEGLTNALKHAQAQNIEIALRFKPEQVELSINDDGCGFDPKALSVNGHFGLRGVEERARILNAKLKLDSTSGRGTRLLVTVPASRLKET
jgi:signal transduction histidine kinase